MKKFKSHTHFPKEKDLSNYLFPHVCFTCSKSFRKPQSNEKSICPDCRGSLIRLSRKFTTPKKTDKAEWRKIQFLVDHGFRFQSIYELVEGSGGAYRVVNYPRTIKEAKVFVTKHNSNAFPHAF